MNTTPSRVLVVFSYGISAFCIVHGTFFVLLGYIARDADTSSAERLEAIATCIAVAAFDSVYAVALPAAIHRTLRRAVLRALLIVSVLAISAACITMAVRDWHVAFWLWLQLPSVLFALCGAVWLASYVHIITTSCRNCGYDLLGIVGGVCPECGTTITQ